jgi:hypothetical protein
MGVFFVFVFFLDVSHFKPLSDFVSLAILVVVIGSLGSSLAVRCLVMAGDKSLNGFLVFVFVFIVSLGLGTIMMELSLLIDEWGEKSGGTYVSRLKGSIKDGECSGWKSGSSHQGLALLAFGPGNIIRITYSNLSKASAWDTVVLSEGLSGKSRDDNVGEMHLEG